MKVLKIANTEPVAVSEKVEKREFSEELSLFKELKNLQSKKERFNNKQILSKQKDQEFDKKDELDSLLKRIRERLDPLNKVLKVEIDKDLKIPVFKIIDEDTKEVIRQIPWEETLKLWKALEELLKREGLEKAELKGILLEKEV